MWENMVQQKTINSETFPAAHLSELFLWQHQSNFTKKYIQKKQIKLSKRALWIFYLLTNIPKATGYFFNTIGYSLSRRIGKISLKLW